MVSFGYLHSLKVDYLKIDGSYIRGLAASKDNQFYVQAITEIAHGLDIRVIAEFVETADDFAALCELRLDGGQGYYLGKPEAGNI